MGFDEQLAQFVFAGLKSGAIYALMALGFTIVYAATGAINFAQGEFFMLGGMLAVWSLDALGVPLLLAGLLAIILTSVSYTHLRAHETDSYLVCRLLLEKKKKKKH